MIKNIALIYPPGPLYQRGEDRCQGNIEDSAATSMRACNDLGYAAAVLRDNYNIFLRDYQTERKSFDDLIKDFKIHKIDCVLLSTTNATIYDDIDIISRIKNRIKNIKVILKGAIFFNPEKEMLDLLNLDYVDVLIGSEIDSCIDKVIDALNGKYNFEDINGIVYKSSNNIWNRTKFGIFEQDLDKIPFPARDLMNNKLYIRPDTGLPMATIQTSRGCPSNCIYCLSPIVSGKCFRTRSAENVFEEIKECYFRYGIKNFFFKADTFTLNAEWAKELCTLIINSELWHKIEFTVNSRVRPLNEETIKLLKKAGCFTIAFGFESGSNKTLKLAGKGTTTLENIKAMQWCRKYKLQVYGFFMIGFPWETKEDIELTKKFIFKLNPDFIEVHIALPYYGTKLYEQCKERNLLKKHTFGSDYFHSNTIGTETISMEELTKIRKDILLHYYLRPNYILKKFIGAMYNPKIIMNYIKYGLRLIKRLL